MLASRLAAVASLVEPLISRIYLYLPEPAVYTAAYLTADHAAPSDGIDRISGLPDALLRDIVSRLPANDAARTAVLATRWRGVWRSAPLVLIDFHLSGGEWPPTNSPSVAIAVFPVLEAHPGPFRSVHLFYSHMSEYQAELRLRRLAAKGVQELILVNRPWPINVPLPSTLFNISTLTRLYIGVWKFPDATGLRGVAFPYLRELGLCCVSVEKNGDIDAVVARSPVLEILNIYASMQRSSIQLISNSLRCVQVHNSKMEEIAVVNAPCLERLFLLDNYNIDGFQTRVKIGNAPKLRLLGYLELGNYGLEIRDTVIKAGMEATPSMMFMSVRILSFAVCFGVHKDIKMMPTFLRCFPNVETLHITSADCDHPTGHLDRRFWAGPIISVQSRIKAMTFSEFRGEQSELSFLQFFFESALVLQYVVITVVNPRSTSLLDELLPRIMSNELAMVVRESNGDEDRLCTFEQGADFSDEDPFTPFEIPSSPPGDIAAGVASCQAS